MKRKLTQSHTLVKSNLYPLSSKNNRLLKPYLSLLGIGGNLGDVLRRFNHLYIHLERSSFIEIIETAPIVKNPPFGYLEQDDFYNSLIIVKTCLRPKALLRYILSIEKRFGRKRSFQDAPRTLDIDIIFYEDVEMQSKKLTLPHHGWKERDSVLIPLSYMKSTYVKEKYAKRE